MTSKTLPSIPVSPYVEIEKSDIARIRVSRSIYRGHEFIDVRTFVKDDAGEFIPTQKGITVPPEQLDTLIHALRRLQLEEEGREA